MISYNDWVALQPETVDYIKSALLLLYFEGRESVIKDFIVLTEKEFQVLNNAGIEYEIDCKNNTCYYYGPVDRYDILFDALDDIEKELEKIKCHLVICKYRYDVVVEKIIDDGIRDFIKTLLRELGYPVSEKRDCLVIREK